MINAEVTTIASPDDLVNEYFESQRWRAFRFQRSCWRAYQQGQSGIVHSATGTGKTLAVWMGPLIKWMRENPDTVRWNPKRPPPVRVLWTTPLRALAADTEASLRAPLDAFQLPWRLESRTGDSKPSMKARQLKRLPTALVTTPESLSLLLTHEQVLTQLAGLEAVIIDEWHELLGSKRGVQTELALARLRKLNPNLRSWALSATLGNMQQAADTLVGCTPNEAPRLIEGYRKKKLKFESIIPATIERFPWTGHIGTKMAPQVAQRLNEVDSALVFTNTRSQSEIWYQELLKLRPDWAGSIALHHGSLDAEVRSWAEEGLRNGELKAVVCTSSLDLGVDFTAVDFVVQVGSPKGSARLLQRAGRSGHQPDAVSRLAFVPTNAIELAELAAAQQAIKEQNLESYRLLDKPLDVLAQHAITIAIGGGFRPSELLDEVRSTSTYRTLNDTEWQWILAFVEHGGSSLKAYPDFQRVEVQDGRYKVTKKRVMTMHRMNIGTIVSDTAMVVKYMSGKRLGMVEESFLSKLKKDCVFVFAGKLVSLARVQDNVAYVRRAKGKPNAVPRWMGGRMPLSAELGDQLRRKFDEASRGQFAGKEMKAIRPLLEVQTRWSVIPRMDQLLIEQQKTRSGWQLFVYCFEGRLVHEGLAAVAAYRLAQAQKTTFSIACNDYGFVLQSTTQIDPSALLDGSVFSSDSLVEDIHKSMNATEMAKRQFRQIARVAGLVHQGLPTRRKSSKHLMASSNLFFDVFCNYDPENLLLQQAEQEVLDLQLDANRLQRAIRRIEDSEIILVSPEKMTPLAFPLLVDKLRERLSSESLAERVARMQKQLEAAAG